VLPDSSFRSSGSAPPFWQSISGLSWFGGAHHLESFPSDDDHHPSPSEAPCPPALELGLERLEGPKSRTSMCQQLGRWWAPPGRARVPARPKKLWSSGLPALLAHTRSSAATAASAALRAPGPARPVQLPRPHSGLFHIAGDGGPGNSHRVAQLAALARRWRRAGAAARKGRHRRPWATRGWIEGQQQGPSSQDKELGMASEVCRKGFVCKYGKRRLQSVVCGPLLQRLRRCVTAPSEKSWASASGTSCPPEHWLWGRRRAVAADGSTGPWRIRRHRPAHRTAMVGQSLTTKGAGVRACGPRRAARSPSSRCLMLRSSSFCPGAG